jgi:hypothetical protein
MGSQVLSQRRACAYTRLYGQPLFFRGTLSIHMWRSAAAPDGGDAWAPAKPTPDETLIRALARAHRWKRLLEEKRYRSAGEIAQTEGVTRSFVNRLLRLTLLSPDIVETILDGRQPKGLHLEELTKRRCRASGKSSARHLRVSRQAMLETDLSCRAERGARISAAPAVRKGGPRRRYTVVAGGRSASEPRSFPSTGQPSQCCGRGRTGLGTSLSRSPWREA